PLRVARATIVQRHADREDQVVSRLVAGKPSVGVVVPSRDGRDGRHPEELVVGDRSLERQDLGDRAPHREGMLPWLRRLVGGRAPEQITAALRRRYRRYRLADERFEQREQ